jgi:hypothetical protein
MPRLLLTGDLGPELIGPSFERVRSSTVALIELARCDARSIVDLS